MNPLVAQIHSVLPQTQCTKCGYDGCLPYATAIAEGEAINRCPPGGEAGIAALAALLSRPTLPLNTEECGEHVPLQLARIEERHCIGCTLCIKACPVDAIVGANKYMHTIMASRCTGCELCVAPCPVDCISMVPAQRQWTQDDASAAWQHYQAREARLEKEAAAEQQRLATAAARSLNQSRPTQLANNVSKTDERTDPKQAAIAAALAKARARRNAVATSNDKN